MTHSLNKNILSDYSSVTRVAYRNSHKCHAPFNCKTINSYRFDTKGPRQTCIVWLEYPVTCPLYGRRSPPGFVSIFQQLFSLSPF